MYEQFRKDIQKYELIGVGDRIVAGVSGGADSVCLLALLLEIREEYQLSIMAVHVNHGIRKTKACHDEAFVHNFCMSRGLDYRAIYADVPSISAKTGCSLEESGRNARYEAFQEAALLFSADKIAVAHHQDDQAETVLFHLFRGSGLSGMKGIPRKRDNIIRPLLSFGREEIELYLRDKNLDFCTDETNFENEYSRNKIRNIILPYVKGEINSGASIHITAFAEQCEEFYLYLEKQVQESLRKAAVRRECGFEVSLEQFSSYDPIIRKELLRKLIAELTGSVRDITRKHIMAINDLADKQVGKQIALPYGLTAKRLYKQISIGWTEKEGENDGLGNSFDCVVPGCYELPYWHGSVIFKVLEYEKSMRIPKKRYTKWFDYDKIRNTITIRTRRKGDFLHIRKQSSIFDELSADQGRKSLKSYFIDEKIAKEQRDQIPLITEGNHVLWVLDGRSSEGCLVDDSTTRVLQVEWKGLAKKEERGVRNYGRENQGYD